MQMLPMTPVDGKSTLKALADSPGFFSHIQSPYSTVKKISETSWISFDSLQESSEGMEVICLVLLSRSFFFPYAWSVYLHACTRFIVFHCRRK
jgi:hypothetical protein